MAEDGSGTAVPLLTNVEYALIQERVSAVMELLGGEGAGSVVGIANIALWYAATAARESFDPESAKAFDLIDESVTLQGVIVGISAVAAILTVDEAFEQMKRLVDAK